MIDKLYLFLRAFKNVDGKLEVIRDENTVEGLNNRLFDIIAAIQSSPFATEKILETGGFANAKQAKEDIDNLTGRNKRSYNPVRPVTQARLVLLNMIGVKDVGIFANLNKAHSVSQLIRTAIRPTYVFTLNGLKKSSLHDEYTIIDERGVVSTKGIKRLISRAIGELIGASTDTSKDPVLDTLNFDVYTADLAAILLRLGFSVYQVGVLMNQPCVKRASLIFRQNTNTGMRKEDAIRKAREEILRNLDSKLLATAAFKSRKDLRAFPFELADMENQIAWNGTYDPTFDVKVALLVDYMFTILLPVTEAAMCKPDTNAAAIGSDIPTVDLKITKVENLTEYLSYLKKAIDNVIFTVDPKNYMTIYYNKVLLQVGNLLNRYFVEASPVFSIVKDLIYTNSGTKTSKLISNIYANMFTYVLSGIPFFGNEVTANNQVLTLLDKRYFFKHKFGTIIKLIRNKYPDLLKDSIIMNNLRMKRGGRMYFSILGKISTNLREKISRDWMLLVSSPNPIIAKVGIDLVKWSFFEDGFENGNTGLLRYLPAAISDMIPRYYDAINSLRTTSSSDFENFIRFQYVANHLNNKALVKDIRISPTTSEEVIDGQVVLVETPKGPDIVNNEFTLPVQWEFINKEFKETNDTLYRWVRYRGKIFVYAGVSLYTRLTKTGGITYDRHVYKEVKPLENTYDPNNLLLRDKTIKDSAGLLLMVANTTTDVLNDPEVLSYRFGYTDLTSKDAKSEREEVKKAMEEVADIILQGNPETVEVKEIEPTIVEDAENNIPCSLLDSDDVDLFGQE